MKYQCPKCHSTFEGEYKHCPNCGISFVSEKRLEKIHNLIDEHEASIKNKRQGVIDTFLDKIISLFHLRIAQSIVAIITGFLLIFLPYIILPSLNRNISSFDGMILYFAGLANNYSFVSNYEDFYCFLLMLIAIILIIEGLINLIHSMSNLNKKKAQTYVLSTYKEAFKDGVARFFNRISSTSFTIIILIFYYLFIGLSYNWIFNIIIAFLAVTFFFALAQNIFISYIHIKMRDYSIEVNKKDLNTK